jgi:hypothetical protein
MIEVPLKLQPTGCITDVGGFDAGQARIVKPHIDLKMKLHKKLNKDCPARTDDE